jgi:5-(carboxyamino)imidazole ribonucleotide synthase
VGVLGGGQLARMMAEAAVRLDVRLRVYQTSAEGPSSVLPDVHTGAWTDSECIDAFLAGCDVVTLDNEWVDLGTVVDRLPPDVSLRPGVETMNRVRDKIRQKAHMEAYGLPLGLYEGCHDRSSLDEVARRFGFPLVAKRPTHSYDGYGNRTVHDRTQLHAAFDELGGGGPLLVEQWVPFVQELAVIVARRPGGQAVAYPVTATQQRNHKCESVEVPAAVEHSVAELATELSLAAAEVFDCVGVVGVELFMLEDGRLLLNEIAPRPHNTGHYTIDACSTSQFENHLRAVLDLPLGETTLLRPAAAMVNVLGKRLGKSQSASLASALAVPGASVHLYGKDVVRPGRKMGHVTAVGASIEEARNRATEAARRLEL